MRNNSKKMALGGVMAALAVVIMCMGGLIPVATFVCPMLCMILLWIVAHLCGSRIGWAWYGAVAILCILLGPDKEAAAIFLCLGYYPLIKPKLDRLPLSLLWKLLLFNAVICAAYTVMIRLLGMEQIAADYAGIGMAMACVTLLLGNITFFLLDMVFDRMARWKKR